MASIMLLLSICMLSLLVLSAAGHDDSNIDQVKVKGCPFNALYSFGGSSSDTGNLLYEELHSSKDYYGYIDGVNQHSHHHHHRNSDGLLILDFLASALHLPSPKPYLLNKKEGKFDYGSNFAVDGATAIDASVIKDVMGIKMPWTTTNYSLNVQIDWFMTHLTSICSNDHECRKKLRRAMFLVGDIGSTDYYFAFFRGKTIEEVTNFVPQVVQSIKDAITRLISAGAVNVMVPGIFPIGCLPSYRKMFPSDDPSSYEHSNNCLRGLNTLSKVHNNLLRQALAALRNQHPHVQIIYADYYKAYKALHRNHVLLGFKKSSLGKSCCASKGVIGRITVCSEPNKYIHWDGIHLTQEANKDMVEGIIEGSFLYPKLNLPEERLCVM